MHTLSENALGEALESIDAENPQARSEGMIEEEEEGNNEMIAEKMFGD